ncbi:hypothetical protein FLONG3_9036 [Fusarium longipes]|uniref:2EXR domain-containing protein n=1 Tax=Fusarium longipes TaxID=694270 RepID=A0A395S0Q0_9HYPO|nr:hypothetical protein FLONG3_9036 [Fusarium longipes]
MALTTFHPFPRLPFELRTQIWEAACLELCRSFRGIHYVTVGSLDVAPLSHNWDGSKPKNNSIYLWDAGLWTACQESKRVIAKHWEKQPRPEHDVDIYNCCSYEEANYYYDTFWPEWDFRNTVTMLYSRVDGEHWRQMVDYRKDLLCVTVDDWEFVAIKSDDIDLQIFLFHDHDVAIEFDPSWLVDLDWHLFSDMPIGERI